MNNKLNIEIEGKSVEEAIKKALKTLGLKREEVRIEVLCEEKKGLFGMPGAKLAKIRVVALTSKEKS